MMVRNKKTGEYENTSDIKKRGRPRSKPDVANISSDFNNELEIEATEVKEDDVEQEEDPEVSNPPVKKLSMKSLLSNRKTRRKIPIPAPATDKWSNRIVGSEWVDPTTLTANPLNFRKHPEAQTEYLTSVLADIGWVQEIVVNKLTGRIIDGHLRAALAMANNESKVPVKYVELSDEEEKIILATFDRISSLADISCPELQELLNEAETSNQYIGKMLYEMAQDFDLKYEFYTPEWEQQEEEREKDGKDVPSDIEVPDCIFSSDNEYGIPDLRLDMCANHLDLPILQWGTRAAKVYMKGTYYFYQFDFRFRELWEDPSPILKSGCKNITEVNFSVCSNLPKAVAVYRIYQKRWISRWLQENGIKILVDLHVDPSFQDLNCCGVPKGWSAFSTRSYSNDPGWDTDIIEQFKIAQEISGKKKPLFVVFQGNNKVAKLCDKYGWLHVKEHSDTARLQSVEEYARKQKEGSGGRDYDNTKGEGR